MVYIEICVGVHIKQSHFYVPLITSAVQALEQEFIPKLLKCYLLL